jgi:hypothetical protein
VLLALALPAAWAQTAPLVGDAFINPGSASNFGGTVNVNVGGASGSQGLFLFDLTALPAGTTASNVSVATLRLFLNKVGAAGSVNVYAAATAWSESTVNGLPGPGPAVLIAGAVPVSVAGSYVVIPVTSQVQAWLSGAPNNGFLITASPSSTSVFFDSKENQSTSHPAVLEIDLASPSGAPGTPGTAGAAGATGATGPTGAIGPAGASGPQGAAGLAGAAGATGPIGPAGPSGAAGATGAAGFAGAQGPTGPIGTAGPAGAAGPSGPTGATGPVGPTGPAGATGVTGAAGLAGAAGAAGLINNGFTVAPAQSGNFTIPSTETRNQLFVTNALNNGAANSNNITLPLTTAVGAGFTIEINVVNWGADDGTFTVFTQTGDTIIDQGGPGFGPFTSLLFNYQAQLVTDGNHHWYILVFN